MDIRDLASIIKTDNGHAIQVDPSNNAQLLIYKTDADGVEQLYRVSLEKVINHQAYHDNAKDYLKQPHTGHFTF